MKKVLLTALSGALIALASSSWALNKEEMEESIAAKTGLTKAQSHNALDAFEKQLRHEMDQKKSVRLDGFGTFTPKEIKGQRDGRNPRTGASLTYDSWGKVKTDETVREKAFVQAMATRANMSTEDADKALEAYKESVKSTLKKGGTYASRGEGTYEVGKRAARTGRNPQTGEPIKIKAAKVPKYNDGGNNHVAFTAGKGLKETLNGK